MRITLYKGSEAVQASTDLFANPALDSFPFDEFEGIHEGNVLVKTSGKDQPSWYEVAQRLSGEPIGAIPIRSGAALAVFRTDQGWFALTLGQARSLLNLERIQPRYGLRVVLNSVDPSSLRSMDVKTYEATKFQKRLQPADRADLDEFGLDTRRDFVRAVTGTSKVKSFGRTLTGRDSVSMSVDADSLDLVNLCLLLEEAYSAEAYRDRFAWIDSLIPITSSTLTATLDEQVLNRLKRGAIDAISLSPPEIVDYESIRGFRYQGLTPATVLQDGLDISTFLEYIESVNGLTIEYLKQKHVQLYGDGEAMERSWPIYRCLVADISHRGKDYVLSESEWFEAESDYLATIKEYLAANVPECALAFPDFGNCEDEGAYNELLADHLNDALLQDKKLVGVSGTRGSVEPCDVMTKSKHLIHVKRKTRSASLSHLFAQGRVAGALFMESKPFRKKWRSKIRGEDRSFLSVVPLAGPSRNEYEVVFGITTPKPDDLLDKLPFFSKLNLEQAARDLLRFGYKVSHQGILELPKTKPKKAV